MRPSHFLAIAASLPLSQAVYKGFNYGALDLSGAVKDQAAFEGEFNSARNLQGPKVPYTSARLYTSIQGGTTNSPISAIPAAINTGTTLLLGIWASSGQTTIDYEIAAIQTAINQYGSAFTDLIAGISVGSEDVYRITPTGVASDAGSGADPDTIAAYISQVKAAFPDLGKPVGHVDTYNVWSNSTGWMNSVIEVTDFIGVDAYPYYESTKDNIITNASSIFLADLDAANSTANGKPIWVTETGWPTSGPTEGEAVASVENAETYYQQAACDLFDGAVNTWWYTLQDDDSDSSVPSFGLVAKKEDVLSGPARKPAPLKVHKSTVTRKTRASKDDGPMEAIEDEQEAPELPKKTVSRTAPKPGTLAAAPRRRIRVTPLNPPSVEQTAPAEQSTTRTKKASTRKNAAAKVEEKTEPPKSLPVPAKTNPRSTKSTKESEKKAVEESAETPITRSRPKRTAKAPPETAQIPPMAQAAEPAKTTRLTRTRAASSAKSPSGPVTETVKAKVTKKVTFEDLPDEDKENRLITAKKAPTKKETPATGMRAKPVRKPSTATEKSSATTSRTARGRIEKPAPRVLTPKKITQVNRAAAANASDDDDELCGAKTPVRDLSLSPRRNHALAAALSPVQKLDLNQSLVPRSPVRPIESVMMSPARRLPSPEKEVKRELPLRESPKRGDFTSVLPTASQISNIHALLMPPTRSHLLQSPKRVQLDASAFSHSSMKPKQSPLKASLLGSPARRLVSPKRTTPSSTLKVSSDTPAENALNSPEDVTVTSHFRTSASPVRSGRVYRMSDEELADEMVNDMDFDQSILCVDSPLKVVKQALFDPSKEEYHNEIDDSVQHAREERMKHVPTVVEEMIHDSEVVLAADPADINVVLPKNYPQGVIDEMIQDSTVISTASPSKIEIALPVCGEDHDDCDRSSEDQEWCEISNEGPSSSRRGAEARFRCNPTPSEESEDELSGEKTPARGPRGFRPSLTGDHTRSRLSIGIPPSTNRNLGFTPLAAQMSGWHAASPDKKSIRKTLETQSLFSPIAAQHVDGEVVTTRQSTPRQKTPRSILPSMKRQSLAPRVSLIPPVMGSSEKTSFFEDQMAGFEAQHTDHAALDFLDNFDMNASTERPDEAIATEQPQIQDGSETPSEAEDDTVLDHNANDELTTDLIKFTNASNTAMVDFEELVKEAQEMHEGETMAAEDDDEYGDENIAPLDDMEVTEMIVHTSAHEHFAEFPQDNHEEGMVHGEDAVKETLEQAFGVKEADALIEDSASSVASIPPSPSPSPALSPQPEFDISTPIQRDLSKPRYINTVVSKVPLRPEGQISPIKIPRKRARSLSNAAQQPPLKQSALTPVCKFETESATPSPDRRIRSAAPSPAVTTPGQISFTVDDFGDSTLDAINLPEEEMMDFEVGNPEIAPGSTKSAKTIQSSAATPSRTPLQQLGRGILAGTVVYVEVHTSEGADASGVYIDLLTQMGAKCVREWRWNPRASLNAEDASAAFKVGITHVVYKDGGKRTLEKVRDAMGEVLCVGVRWVLDCEREQRWLDEAPYIVDHAILPRGGSRRRKSMEPSRLSNVNGTVSAKAGRRTSSAEFLTNAMREDLINTPVSTFLSSNTAADDYAADDETEISSTYNSPTTTMNNISGRNTHEENAGSMLQLNGLRDSVKRGEGSAGVGAVGMDEALKRREWWDGQKSRGAKCEKGDGSQNSVQLIMVLAVCALNLDEPDDIERLTMALNRPLAKYAQRQASDYIASSPAESVSLCKSVRESPFVLGLQKIARQHSLLINVGIHEPTEPPSQRVKNTLIWIDTHGAIVHRYQKLHLFNIDLRPDGGPLLKESDRIEPGNVIEPPYKAGDDSHGLGSFGSLICFDLRFAEPAISLRRQGADVLLYPSAFTVPTGKLHWDTLLRARAIETQSYVLAAAQCGRHNDRRVSYGDSIAIDPNGRVLARLERVDDVESEPEHAREPKLLTVDIDLGLVAQTRRGIPLLRREDVYGRL
ncbi:hypothetical protein DV737_g1863, partial [Chaetothyriales sp. CBS 132003]